MALRIGGVFLRDVNDEIAVFSKEARFEARMTSEPGIDVEFEEGAALGRTDKMKVVTRHYDKI